MVASPWGSLTRMGWPPNQARPRPSTRGKPAASASSSKHATASFLRGLRPALSGNSGMSR
eukprot:12888453-Alexandrium_andersonii.AAC.1